LNIENNSNYNKEKISRINFCAVHNYDGVKYDKISGEYRCYKAIFNNDGTFNYEYSGFIK
jgi:hypothetical protein